MSFLLPALILGCAQDSLPQVSSTQLPEDTSWSTEELNTNRILVQRRDGILDNIRFQNLELPILRSMNRLDIHEIEIPEGLDTQKVIEELLNSGEYSLWNLY